MHGDGVAAGFRQPEVGDLGPHGGVEEDVAGFYVFVDDSGPRVLVDVLQAVGDVGGYAQPCFPAEFLVPLIAVQP